MDMEKKEMSEEMKSHMKEMMEKMGMPEEAMTEMVMWGMKKSAIGGMKMMKGMMEAGMSEDKAMETMKKFSEMMMEKEMMDQMKDMMEKWKEKKEEMKGEKKEC